MSDVSDHNPEMHPTGVSAAQKPHLGAAAMAAGFGDVLAKLVSVSKPAEGADESDEDEGLSPRSRFARKPDHKLSDIEKRAMLDTNDKGMAERLTHYSKGQLVYCSQIGWLVWDGHRFLSEDGDAHARREVMKMITPLKFEEYAAIKEVGFDEKEEILAEVSHKDAVKSFLARINRLWAAAITLGNNAKQKSVLEVAGAMDKFLVRFEALDADPGKFNAASGILDLPLSAPKLSKDVTAGEEMLKALTAATSRKAVVADRITKCARAVFNKAAMDADEDLAPVWRAHLNTVLPDKALQRTVQRILGSMLVTHNPGNYWFLFRGPGGDGKSTTLRAVQHALGDYAITGDVKTFLYDSRASASGPRQDLVRLAGGNRLVILPEPEQGDLLSGTTIKITTGGDEISTRAAYGSQVEFRAQFKMVMMCNPRPRVKGDDEAFWRRTIEIPFRHQIAKADRDPQIDEKLKAEADGIFLWLLEGYFDWWSKGFDYDVAPAALSATNAYRREASPMAAWMQDRIIWGRWYDRKELDATEEPSVWKGVSNGDAECIELAQKHYLKTAEANTTPPPEYTPQDIYEDFCAWCEDMGLDPWKMNSFTKSFASRAEDQGCERGRKNALGRYWTGFDWVTGAAKFKRTDDDQSGYPPNFSM